MTQAQGETAVTTSALVLSGIYGSRKTTEKITKAPKTKNVGKGAVALVEGPLGVGELAPLGQWATGMGLTMIALSIATSVNPGFGGSFAILIAVGAVLGNGQAVLKDLGHGLSGGAVSGGKLEGIEPLGPREGLEPLGKREGLEPLGKREGLEAVSSNHPPVK